MDITLTLSPITPLDVQFDTPSPLPPIFSHLIPWNLLEAHGTKKSRGKVQREKGVGLVEKRAVGWWGLETGEIGRAGRGWGEWDEIEKFSGEKQTRRDGEMGVMFLCRGGGARKGGKEVSGLLDGVERGEEEKIERGQESEGEKEDELEFERDRLHG
ncbi:hypothetical protein Tco_1145611 [Tanacetum coccineum]